MSGRLGVAPCGHVGEYVIGTFVQCRTPGCDGMAKAQDVPAIPAHASCPDCGSIEIEPFLLYASPTGGRFMHCWPCGHVWTVDP